MCSSCILPHEYSQCRIIFFFFCSAQQPTSLGHPHARTEVASSSRNLETTQPPPPFSVLVQTRVEPKEVKVFKKVPFLMMVLKNPKLSDRSNSFLYHTLHTCMHKLAFVPFHLKNEAWRSLCVYRAITVITYAKYMNGAKKK